MPARETSREARRAKHTDDVPTGPSSQLHVQAVEQNAERFLLDLGTAGGGIAMRFGGAHGIFGPSPVAYQNAIYRTRLAETEVARVIEDVVAELDARRIPGSWHVGPGDRPSTLVERLRHHGFHDGGEDIGMACDLSRISPPASTLPRTTVRQVRNDADLEAWKAVLSDGFGEGPVEATWAGDCYRHLGLGTSSTHRLVVAELDGEPAAAGASLLDDAVVGLYFIATRPRARRRGLGTAVTHRLAVDGAAAGARTAVLGASPAGRPVYTRLGFAEVSRIRILERPVSEAADA